MVVVVLSLLACGATSSGTTSSGTTSSGTTSSGTTSSPADGCDVAWDEIVHVRDGLAARRPDVVAPDEAGFRAACEALPADARACVSMAGLLADPDGCRRTLDALPPARRAALRAALGDEAER